MAALEDSLIKLEAIKPAYQATLLSQRKQKEFYESEGKENMFEKVLLKLQLSESQKALIAEREAGTRKSTEGLNKGTRRGAIGGFILGLIIAAAAH